eukprot:SAG31_NODE_2904_length_4928_cov_3.585007_3_plen_53_part_00
MAYICGVCAAGSARGGFPDLGDSDYPDAGYGLHIDRARHLPGRRYAHRVVED